MNQSATVFLRWAVASGPPPCLPVCPCHMVGSVYSGGWDGGSVEGCPGLNPGTAPCQLHSWGDPPPVGQREEHWCPPPEHRMK